jgi:hypothetical protein
MANPERLNLAYGSNLNLEQMHKRCPSAEIAGKGILENYRLLFKGQEGHAYLTIEPYDGSFVPVLLWSLEPSDEIALDKYEEFPDTYYKENLLIKKEDGKYITAMAYIMTEPKGKERTINLPSKRYLNTVFIGYEENGFDKRIIEAAVKFSENELEKKS